MARNGSGTYSLAAGNPVVTGSTISSTTHNNTMTDIETALTGSIAANGETPITGSQVPGSDGAINFGSTSKRIANVYADAIGDIGQALTNNALYNLIPNQPAFLGKNDVSELNVTGDSTAYTIVLDTEVFDQGSDYDLTTFTAPVTGRYLLTAQTYCQGHDESSHNLGTLAIVTSNKTYSVAHVSGTGVFIPTERVYGGSIICDMDAADTATFRITVSGGAKTIDVAGDTYFSGCLLA